MIIKKSNIRLFLLTFLILSDSPIVSMLGIPVIAVFVCFFVFDISINFKNYSKILKYWFIGSLILLITSFGSSLYNNSYKPIAFSILFITYFLFSFQFNTLELKRFVKYITVVLFISLFLSVLAIIFSSLGFLMLFNYGPLLFYPFSFLYPADGMLMRIAGLWHEPGQLSFLICFTVTLRHILKMNSTLNIVLLLFGVLTASLAHFTFAIGYFIIIFIQYNNRYKLIIGSLSILLAILISTTNLSWVINRTNIIRSEPENFGRLASYNFCLNLLENNPQKILMGPKKNLANRELESEDLLSEDLPGVSIYGENPLSPLIYGGLMSSWPYYAIILFSLLNLVYRNKNSFIFFLLILLTIQRPYTMEFPYALMIGVILSALLRNIKSFQEENLTNTSRGGI